MPYTVYVWRKRFYSFRKLLLLFVVAQYCCYLYFHFRIRIKIGMVCASMREDKAHWMNNNSQKVIATEYTLLLHGICCETPNNIYTAIGELNFFLFRLCRTLYAQNFLVVIFFCIFLVCNGKENKSMKKWQFMFHIFNIRWYFLWSHQILYTYNKLMHVSMNLREMISYSLWEWEFLIKWLFRIIKKKIWLTIKCLIHRHQQQQHRNIFFLLFFFCKYLA